MLLGVDVGTSGTKGVLVNRDGTVIAMRVWRHSPDRPRPGFVEQDAVSVWWAGFVAVVRGLVPECGGSKIDAVGVSGIGPCLLPCDVASEPLRPAILYGVDTRATREIEELEMTYGREAIRERCGTPLTSQAVGPKMIWLQRNEAVVWTAARRWFMTNSYLAYKLTGAYVADHGSASQAAPLYDVRERSWAADWCDAIAPQIEWPELRWPAEVVGQVTADAAKETGLPSGVPVVIGTTDAWAEACGAGVREVGDTALTYGTTLVIIKLVEDSTYGPELGTIGVLPAFFSELMSLVGTLTTAGEVAEWVSRLTSLTHEQLIAEAAKVACGADGLLMLPYFAGMRTPDSQVRLHGVIAGLDVQHRPAHLYRAALEGIAFGVRHNLSAMSAASGGLRRICASGGGTSSRLLLQIVSDVLQLPQEVPRETVGAAYGDAFFAGVGVGEVDSKSSWNSTSAVVEPNPRHADIYGRLFDGYLEVLGAIQDLVGADAEPDS